MFDTLNDIPSDLEWTAKSLIVGRKNNKTTHFQGSGKKWLNLHVVGQDGGPPPKKKYSKIENISVFLGRVLPWGRKSTTLFVTISSISPVVLP